MNHPQPLQRGENNPQAKLTNAQAAQIKRRLSRGDSIWILAKHYRVSHSAIWQIKKGKTWKY